MPAEEGATPFATTRWNLVVQASRAAAGERQGGASSEDAELAREALSELCRLYWYPVYAFVRRRRGADRAADLTQEFSCR